MEAPDRGGTARVGVAPDDLGTWPPQRRDSNDCSQWSTALDLPKREGPKMVAPSTWSSIQRPTVSTMSEMAGVKSE
jgi:hypothetical protein